MFEKNIYIERRKKLSQRMKKGIGLFVGHGDAPKNYKDNCYGFSQDSTFLYYFGLNRQDLVGIINFSTGETYISGVDFSIDDMIWMGAQPTILEEAKKVGIEKFIKSSNLKEFIIDLSEGTDEDSDDYYQEILFINPYRAETVIKIAELLDISHDEVENYYSAKLHQEIIEERNSKTTEEIKEIEKAVNVTRMMHLKAMEIIKPGMYEYEIKAEVERVAALNGYETSFQTIATVRGEVLHNHVYGNQLKEGDLFVLDCGARTESGYCGDMTTTIPVSGKYTDEQKNIYNLLIKMYDAAEKELLVGNFYKDSYVAAVKELIEGMKELELLKGDSKEILEKGAYSIFFPHGLGHMLGMDVHDCENLGENFVGYDKEIERDTRPGYKSLRLARRLKEGYVFTVEPGIYFIPRLIDTWKNKGMFVEHINYEKLEGYKNFGGMRYEGNYVIESKIARRLGEKMPKKAEEIEEIIGKIQK